MKKIPLLFVFDIEGNPLVRFVCLELLSVFDVDWERNIVYGVSPDKEAKIFAYRKAFPTFYRKR